MHRKDFMTNLSERMFARPGNENGGLLNARLDTLLTPLFFMPPTLKKWGAFSFRLVHPSVSVSVLSKKNLR